MRASPASAVTRLRRVRPEPARFWLAVAPAVWSWESTLWTDLAGARLGRPADPARVGPWPPEEGEDVVYLPPGSADPGATCAGRGSFLAQRLPGIHRESGRRAPSAGGEPRSAVWVVWDLLPALLARDLSAFGDLPAGSAVWPLVAGLTDDRSLWEAGLPLLAGAGVRHVQPLTLELDPVDRRRLAAFGDEGAYAALFHGPAPSERSFSRFAARWGFVPFRRRPVPEGPGRRWANRRLAGELLLAGELWLRCGRGEAEGHALLSAGRRVEQSEHDLPALAREGNLEVVPWLDDAARTALAEAAERGASRLVADLEAEYLEEAG